MASSRVGGSSFWKEAERDSSKEDSEKSSKELIDAVGRKTERLPRRQKDSHTRKNSSEVFFKTEKRTKLRKKRNDTSVIK